MRILQAFLEKIWHDDDAVPKEIMSIVQTIIYGKYDEHNEAIKKLSTHKNKLKAIKPLLDYFQIRKDKIHEVCDALCAIGTVEVVEPLLHIFKSTAIERAREFPSDYKDRGGAPARSLVRMKGALQVLKEQCPFDVYEEILLRSHDSGDFRDPELNRKLGEMGSPRAINRLLSVLWREKLDSNEKLPAIEALANIGPSVLANLCTELKETS